MRSRTASLLLAVVLFISFISAAGYSEHNRLLLEQQQWQEKVEKAKAEATEPQLLVFEDIPYGDHEKQTFDLYLPVDSRKKAGLVVYLHGGGWRGGDKSDAKRSFDVFQQNSLYATASVNYRLVKDGEYDIYDIIDDITLALAKIRSLSEEYSVSLSGVILGGHSAGGHLSLLYAYKYKDVSPVEPVGVFAASPVPDLALDCFYTDNTKGDEEYMCRYMSKVFGEKITPENRADYEELLELFSPINYISRECVPTVILHGEEDRIAPFYGSELLCEKLSEYRVNHELVVFEDTKHSLSGKSDKKDYANELMTACAIKLFGITDNNE